MSSKSQWRELAERLRDRYRLIAIDLHGYGESAMPSSCDGYGLCDELRLVESVLARELRPGEQFHLVGHSYGGIIALQLAAQAGSQRVRSLSLFEPIAFHLLPAGDPDFALLESIRSEIADRLHTGDAHGGAGCFVDYWSGAGAFAQLREERQSVLAAQVPKVLLEFRAVVEESWDVAAYRRIGVPTCLVAGKWSPDPAQRLTSMLADMLPHASCFEVEAGHMAPITHPELVNPILEQFIRAVDASEHRWVTRGHERSLAIPNFSELTTLRGHGWSRAIAVGLLGVVLSALAFNAGDATAHEESGMATQAVYPLEEDAWHEGPPGMPPGGKFAVISGDPLAAGTFVMCVQLPPGYVLPPSRLHGEAQMVVLAGDITVGVVGASGATTDHTLTSGSFMTLAASELHLAHTETGAIVQIFGSGPFEVRPA
jgi:pimeloyl-ACP methyl ester carboxylesterase